MSWQSYRDDQWWTDKTKGVYGVDYWSPAEPASSSVPPPPPPPPETEQMPPPPGPPGLPGPSRQPPKKPHDPDAIQFLDEFKSREGGGGARMNFTRMRREFSFNMSEMKDSLNRIHAAEMEASQAKQELAFERKTLYLRGQNLLFCRVW